MQEQFDKEKQVLQEQQDEESKLQHNSDEIQSDQPSYKQKEYWNERYKSKETFYDWYCGYEELKLVFEKCYNLSKDAKILMIGCGNSKLSEDMFDDGYTNIVSTDISDVVIEQMKQQTQKLNKNMTFEVQDCTNLTYQDQTFDFVFDKGTLDALSCDNEEQSVNKMLTEMMRVCKSQGSVVIVSFGQLHERKPTFKESLGFENYSYQLCQKYLSIDSQLTNIMRHISNGLPMNLVLKSKTLLLQTLIEVRNIKGLLKNEVIQSLEIDWENVADNAQHQAEEGDQNEDSIEEGQDENSTENISQSNDHKQTPENQNELNKNDKIVDNESTTNSLNDNQDSNQSKSSLNEVQCKKQQEIQNIQDDKSQEEYKVHHKNSQQSIEIQEKEYSQNEDQEEKSNQEGNKQKKSKFRRQTQCFIYRISHKN